MRIGFFSDYYLPGIDGVARSVESFRLELEAMGHDVFVLAPAPGLRYRDPSSRVLRFPALKGLFMKDYLTSLYFPPQALRRIDKLELDIVHFHTPSQIGLLGAYYAIRNDIPLVTTHHTDLHEYVKHYPQVLPGIMALSLLVPFITGGGLADYRTSLSSIKPMRSLDRWNQQIIERGLGAIYGACDAVVAPSTKMHRQLKLWLPQSNIKIIPTGVNSLPTSPQAIAAAKRRYHISDSDEVILFVGRIGGEKNPALLMRAFDQVATKRPNAKLMLVGPGPDLEDLRDQVQFGRWADRIILPGRIEHDQLGAIYGLAKVFAFPSLTDTQGLVLNEAAHAGLPIVMIDPFINDVVQARKNGLFARAVPCDFAVKLLAILEDPKLHARMSQHSLELASKYSAQHQTQSLSDLYDYVRAHHKSHPIDIIEPIE